MQIHIRLNRDSAYWGEWGNDLDRAQEVYAEALEARVRETYPSARVEVEIGSRSDTVLTGVELGDEVEILTLLSGIAQDEYGNGNWRDEV